MRHTGRDVHVRGCVQLAGPGGGRAAPSDRESMADAVSTLLGCDRQTLRRRARAQAERFPWKRAAESVLAVHLGQRERERCA